ncbi:MAG: hypothetical protein L0271_27100 [Gemmatimonadetes bacterium]|nr:hypothetical protein [Gemmatimonadota bacterium]
MTLFIVIGTLTVSACLDSTTPVTPSCTGTLGLDLPDEPVQVGDVFMVTATHVIEQCLNNLSWSATGVISFQVAEETSARFRANQSGTGTITVRNNQGNVGIADVEVEEGEGGG